jgi:hypothetical protein
MDVDGNVNSGTNNGVPLVNTGIGSAACPTPSASCPGLSFNETGVPGQRLSRLQLAIRAQWVAGVEGDFGWADNKKSSAGAVYPAGGAQFFFLTQRADDSFGVKADWDASLRLRDSAPLRNRRRCVAEPQRNIDVWFVCKLPTRRIRSKCH